MSTAVQTVVPGTEGHDPTAKPKRKRGPSKKTREALERAEAEGFAAGVKAGRPPMLGVLGIFIIGAIIGAVIAWAVK